MMTTFNNYSKDDNIMNKTNAIVKTEALQNKTNYLVIQDDFVC